MKGKTATAPFRVQFGDVAERAGDMRAGVPGGLPGGVRGGLLLPARC